MKNTKYVLFAALLLVTMMGATKCQLNQSAQVNSDTDMTKTMTVAERFQEVEKIAHDMPKNGMKRVMELFPDLVTFRTVAKADADNVVGLGDEPWQYSASADVTVIVCEEYNTPAYIFRGKTITVEKLAEIKAMVGDMMKMMMGDEDGMMMDGDNTMMEHKDDMQMEGMMAEGSAEKDMDKDMIDTKMEEKESGMMEKNGMYTAYDPALLANANNGSVVLFFNASWCPTCRAADADIKAHLADLPANLTILSVDYDTYTDLKNKYGVPYQHTFVQVDAQGNEIKKWNGSPTLHAIIEQLA